MTLETNHPEYKSLLYQLLRFLTDKKLSEDGKGISRPISFPLEDFGEVLQYANPQDKAHELLKSELQGLEEEEDQNGRPLLRIMNPDILENFLERFNSNKESITLKYTRENLERYKKQLLAGDRQSSEKGKLYFDEVSHKFRYNGKEMLVKEGRENNIRLNLCLLLFGYQNMQIKRNRCSIREYAEKNGNWSHYNDYSPGEDVELDFLTILLLGMDERIEDPRELDDKPVKDAIAGLNERAEAKFKTEILKLQNRAVRVLHQ